MSHIKIDLRTTFGTSSDDVSELLQRLNLLDSEITSTDTVEVILPVRGQASELALTIIWTKLRAFQEFPCEKTLTYEKRSSPYFDERHFFDRLMQKENSPIWSSKVPFHLNTFNLNDDENATASKVVEAIHKSISSTKLSSEAHIHISELVSNAFHHSQTISDVGCLSRFEPSRSHLEFCIADQGMGIKQSFTRNRVLRAAYISETDARIIEKATDQYVTCNPKSAPQYQHGNSGIGLYFLREFCVLHEGRLVIVSGAGYYSIDSGHVKRKILPVPWAGTVVSFKANIGSSMHEKYAAIRDRFVEDFDGRTFNFSEVKT